MYIIVCYFSLLIVYFRSFYFTLLYFTLFSLFSLVYLLYLVFHYRAVAHSSSSPCCVLMDDLCQESSVGLEQEGVALAGAGNARRYRCGSHGAYRGRLCSEHSGNKIQTRCLPRQRPRRV